MARGLVHVAEFGVCRDGTPTTADGDVGAIPAFLLVRAQPFEALGRGAPPFLVPAVDVAGGFGLLAREARARVERAVGPDRVGVAPMDLARPHVHAIRRGQAAPARLVAEEGHL